MADLQTLCIGSTCMNIQKHGEITHAVALGQPWTATFNKVVSIVVPKDGTYVVGANCAIQAGVSTGTRWTEVQIHRSLGGIIAATVLYNPGNLYTDGNVVGAVELQAGDEVWIQLKSNINSSSDGRCALWLAYVGHD